MRRRRAVRAGVLSLVLACVGATLAVAQERGPTPVAPAELQAAINNLGSLDYPVRTKASATIRRAPAAQVVPALVQAVLEHADGYVRFRALVLLTGYMDPRVTDVMRRAMTDPNDRLRAVAYRFFEASPDRSLIPALVSALDRETSEFVRPELTRALAAQASDPAVQKVLLVDIRRGQDFFRSAVIEAVGDYRVAYAVPALTDIAKLDGPLQDDAALALGKIGDKQALATLSQLQRSAPRVSQPFIASGICLLGVNCASHVNFLAETLTFADKNTGFQELLRSAANALAAVATTGNSAALKTLLDVGVPATDPARAAIALAIGTVALRNPLLILSALETRPDLEAAAALIGEAFDMLEEDFDEEHFFVTVRRTYWGSPEASPARKIAELLIHKLEF